MSSLSMPDKDVTHEGGLGRASMLDSELTLVLQPGSVGQYQNGHIEGEGSLHEGDSSLHEGESALVDERVAFRGHTSKWGV